MSTRRAAPLAAVVSTLWSLAFAALHAVWALGGRILIADPSAADVAFAQTWFRVYNASVALASAGLAALALGALRCPTARCRRVAQRLLWLPAVVLLLRGGIGVGQLAIVVATSRDGTPLASWWIDLFMLGGGGAFAAAARSLTRQSDQSKVMLSSPADPAD